MEKTVVSQALLFLLLAFLESMEELEAVVMYRVESTRLEMELK